MFNTAAGFEVKFLDNQISWFGVKIKTKLDFINSMNQVKFLDKISWFGTKTTLSTPSINL